MPLTSARYDILTVGEPLIEVRKQNGATNTGFGGDVLNVAVAASRLGSSCAIATRLGEDTWGKSIHNFCTDEHIRTDLISHDSGAPTGAYTIGYDENGHHFSYERAGSAASLWGPTEASKLPVSDYSVLHVSGISQAISRSCYEGCGTAMARAKSVGHTVSYDPNFRSKLWSLEQAREGLFDAISHDPILLPGLDDARLLVGLQSPQDIVRFFLDKGLSLVALTAGPDGVFIGHDGELTHVIGQQVDAVDASGAGDCFNGAFLTSLARGATVIDATHFANTAAALSVQKHGAAVSYPSLEECLAQSELKASVSPT